MTSKRILYCEHNIDGTIGGSYYSLFHLANGLDRNKYHPVVVFYTDNVLIPRFREAGIETHVLRPPSPATLLNFVGIDLNNVRVLRSLLDPAKKIVNLFKMLLIPAVRNYVYLRRNTIDIVHLNNSILHNHDWMLAALARGTGCLTHERGINEKFPNHARFFAKRLKAIICISDAVRENMARKGVNYPNIVRIYNGLDPETVRIKRTPEEVRRLLRIDVGDLVIGIVGNIKEWKGQDTVIRAVCEIRKRFPRIRCLFVGDTGEMDRYFEHKLRGLITELGLEENVLFTGFQKDVADFINVMDVLIHASILPEPFGRVLLEGMALRKPIVGSRGGAVPEIIEEGKNGLTFPPGDAIALAGAVETLLSNSEEALKMGERGYERLVREFHIRKNIEATQRLYEQRHDD